MVRGHDGPHVGGPQLRGGAVPLALRGQGRVHQPGVRAEAGARQGGLGQDVCLG